MSLYQRLFKKSKPKEKSLETSLKELDKYTLLDSMVEAPVAVSAFLAGLTVAIYTGNILYTFGAFLLAEVGVGKAHNKIYHYLARKFEPEYNSL